MKKKFILPVALMVAVVILDVVSYFLLPDNVVTQISANASGATTMPKLLALLVPTVFGLGGSAAYLIFKEENKKYLFLAVISIAIFAIMLLVNL